VFSRHDELDPTIAAIFRHTEIYLMALIDQITDSAPRDTLTRSRSMADGR
jgi:hypothetical protein